MFNNFCFRKSCRLWDNVEKYCRVGQVTDIWRMRIACRITKARHTHTKYIILIAFPLQQWLHEHVSILRYTYNACLVLDLPRREDWENREYREMKWTWSGIYVSYNYTLFSKVCHWEIRKWIWFNELNYSETLLSYTLTFRAPQSKSSLPWAEMQDIGTRPHS